MDWREVLTFEHTQTNFSQRNNIALAFFSRVW